MKLRWMGLLLAIAFTIGSHEISTPHTYAQGSFLKAPFSGSYRLTAYVDHQTPNTSNDNNIVSFNGNEYLDCPAANTTWTNQGPYCYDGHEGTDWAMGGNTPVLAAASGTVIFKGVGTGTYGNLIRINHGNGYETWYAHLNSFSVNVGDVVNTGQQIGLSGNTGGGQPYHLHFEVRLSHNSKQTDPFGWLGDSSDPLNNYSGETATCLWTNEWCSEIFVEDGDVNINGTVVKFTQFGGGWQWSATGNSWTMKYVANGDGSSFGYWIPYLPNAGPYEVLAFIPAAANKTTVSYTIHDQSGQYSRSVNQAAYTNQWVSLGTYNFGTGANNYVKLTNDVGSQSGKTVVFDTIKFRQYRTFLPIVFGGGGGGSNDCSWTIDNLLQDGGFSYPQNTPWLEVNTFQGINTPAPFSTLRDGFHLPGDSPWAAKLGGANDSDHSSSDLVDQAVYQEIVLSNPNNIAELAIEYSYYLTTNEISTTTKWDRFFVDLQVGGLGAPPPGNPVPPANSLLGSQRPEYSNLHPYKNQWRRRGLPVSQGGDGDLIVNMRPYNFDPNETIIMVFYNDVDGSLPSTFYVDAVKVKACTYN